MYDHDLYTNIIFTIFQNVLRSHHWNWEDSQWSDFWSTFFLLDLHTLEHLS